MHCIIPVIWREGSCIMQELATFSVCYYKKCLLHCKDIWWYTELVHASFFFERNSCMHLSMFGVQIQRTASASIFLGVYITSTSFTAATLVVLLHCRLAGAIVACRPNYLVVFSSAKSSQNFSLTHNTSNLTIHVWSIKYS